MRVVACALTCAAILGLVSRSPATAADLRYLEPGKRASLTERVPVNFVFVGIEPKDVNAKEFLSVLPEKYKPVERIPTFVREKPQYLGLSYTYDYRTHFTSASYENAFFGYLGKLARPAERTRWQDLYNAQPGRRVDIDNNQTIDAGSVERWLARHAPPGIDTTRNTVFFIDWYGRKDFRFHLYDKPTEPDSPTGTYIGALPDPVFFSAWGGTAADDPEDGRGLLRRVWFYDLSAGPDSWMENWNVTTDDANPADLEVDPDHFVPTSWEYARGGFREPADLVYDLADLARYVSIHTLFTPSPLYPALKTKDGRPASVEFDMNFYDVPGVDTTTKGSTMTLQRSFEHLAPWLRYSTDVKVADMSNPEHLNCFAQWSLLILGGPACYPDDRYGSDADLILFHSKNRKLFFDGGAAHQAGAFFYQVPGQLASQCSAFADDDRLTGAQSFVYAFGGPRCSLTIGWTDLLIHEFGHYLGLSHPHDGFDGDQGFAAQQPSYEYVWAGTEVNSVMSYNNGNNEFSQFDADNVARWATEAFITDANALAKKLLAAKVQAGALRSADDLAGVAEKAIAAHRYRPAVDAARRAFASLAALARKAGIDPSIARPRPAATTTPVPPFMRARGLPPVSDRLCGAQFCR